MVQRREIRNQRKRQTADELGMGERANDGRNM